jgi:hypothetical protein
MIRLPQSILCLLAAIVALTAHSQRLPVSANSSGGQTNTVPNLPAPVHSPVDFFRQLLAMSPDKRAVALTNRSPEIRARILAKVDEYEALDPDERELRLRATDLRWWLTPLLRLPPAQRAARLATVPDDLRELVAVRLEQWSILPPPLQDEILDNEQALHYFSLVPTTNSPAVTDDQHRIASEFNQFFELTPDEKEQTLNTLSEAERAQMKETLKSFDQLPPQQRLLCIRNYAKFASMSNDERAEFLKNAESWSKMSPKERQTWRDLVANVPDWPPMPQDMEPPSPTDNTAPPMPQQKVATNSN